MPTHDNPKVQFRISPETRDHLERIQKDGGFTSLSAVAKSILEAVVADDHAEHTEGGK